MPLKKRPPRSIFLPSIPRHATLTSRLLLMPALACCIVSSADAWAGDPTSPVDRIHHLELLTDEFGLADGPAWDGRSALYVPDVKQSVIKRFLPASKRWSIVHKGTDRYSASIFSHGRLFVSNNSAAKIEAFAGNNIAAGPNLITLLDDDDKPQKRPNDLVVDQHGGVYVTLTRQNQVVYVSPEGTSAVVTEAVISPNGITISPDNSTLYVAAYRPKKIVAFAINKPGQLGDGKDFAAMDDGEALGADGMTIDRAGNVYCAGAIDVWIWAPDCSTELTARLAR
ncbi:MAG: SMP-30/gluconolactonase/LRE family protein [Fuerstiella sp.]|nr:hypothetical protein [Fuerstiella sp.]